MQTHSRAASRFALPSSVIGVALALLTACGDDADDSVTPDNGDADAGAEPDTVSDVADADAGTDTAAPDTADTSDGDAPDVQLPIDPRFAAIAEAVELDLADSNADAASIAVWLDGEVIWVGGFGSPAAGGRPIDEQTQFMIGSDTKKIAAITLLQAVQAGRLALEDTVGEVVPDLEMALAPDFLEATAHDLISHQGGIMDGVEATTEAVDEGLFEFIFGDFADTYAQLAPPGLMWNYSNPNFSVAGFLVEEVDAEERSWADIAVQDVFEPLGMRDTVARKADVGENYVTGIGTDFSGSNEIGPVSFDDTWESAFTRPAGLVWSTPSDQMRLAEFLVDGNTDVLDETLLGTISTPQVPLYPDIPGSYGYGLFVNRGISLESGYYDIPVWSHGGNTVTHTSTFYVLPEQRFAISILSNGLADNFDRTLIAAVTTLVTLPEPTTPPEPVFDAAELDALVGTYVDPDNAGRMIISREGDTLFLDAPDLDAFDVPYEREMTRQSTRVWLINIQEQDLDFAFIDGPNGETYLRNRALVAVREPAGDGKQRPTEGLTPGPAARDRLLTALWQARLSPLPSLMFGTR